MENQRKKAVALVKDFGELSPPKIPIVVLVILHLTANYIKATSDSNEMIEFI